MMHSVKEIMFGRKPEDLTNFVLVEMKMPTGSNQSQKKQGFDYPSTQAMMDYASITVPGYAERWFGYLAIKRGQTHGSNVGAGAQAYLVCYDQRGVYDAGVKLAKGERLPAYRTGGHGQIIMGVTDPMKIMATLRAENLRAKVPIPGCRTQNDVEELCLELAKQAKFDDVARGWELLAGCLLRGIFPYVKHVGDNTDKDGDLWQKGDLVIGRR